MLTERGTGPAGPLTPELWNQAVDCAVRYQEDTGRPVRVDDIQELGIGRNRALKLHQDVLAHLARAAAPVTLPPPSQRWTGDQWDKALRIVAGSVARDTDQRLTATGQWTLMIGRALGLLFIGLAVLAIRGRVKR